MCDSTIKEGVKTLYKSVAKEEKILAYCILHKNHITLTQMKRKQCLQKECKYFRKEQHSFWVLREMKKEHKKLRKILNIGDYNMESLEKESIGVVSLSGGIDSSTCLGLAVAMHTSKNVFAYGFEYGSKHPEEMKNAQIIADYYEVPFTVIKISPDLWKDSSSTLLKGGGKLQLDKSYSQIIEENGEGKVDTYVPGRNLLFMAHINSIAESLSEKYKKLVYVYGGMHADDAAGAAYPDCSPPFYKAVAEAMKISSVDKVIFKAPFINMNKAAIVKLGLSLQQPVPYNQTLSCYEPINGLPCRRCATCIDVEKALVLNNKTWEWYMEGR